MSQLREKLKVRAEQKLDAMINDLSAAAEDICTGTGIEASTLCRIVSSPKHSKTLVNQSISSIVRGLENNLLEVVEDKRL